MIPVIWVVVVAASVAAVLLDDLPNRRRAFRPPADDLPRRREPRERPKTCADSDARAAVPAGVAQGPDRGRRLGQRLPPRDHRRPPCALGPVRWAQRPPV